MQAQVVQEALSQGLPTDRVFAGPDHVPYLHQLPGLVSLSIITSEAAALDVSTLSPASLPSLRRLELDMDILEPGMANLSQLTQLDSLLLTDILPNLAHDSLPFSIRHLRLDVYDSYEPLYRTCTEELRAFSGQLLTLCIPAPYLSWAAPGPYTAHYLSELPSLQTLVHLELGVFEEQPSACDFRLPVLKYVAINMRLSELPLLLPWNFAACPSLGVFRLELEPEKHASFDIRDLCNVRAPLLQVHRYMTYRTDEVLSLQLRPQTFPCLRKVVVSSDDGTDSSNTFREAVRAQFEGINVNIE